MIKPRRLSNYCTTLQGLSMALDYWGYHVMVDASMCDRVKITDRANVDAFARELVKRIDMKAYGDPQIVKFGTGNKAGFTLVQLIETSNICAHFCDDTGDVYFDVFSCKPFDVKVVEEVIKEYFEPSSMKTKFIYRQA